MSAAAKAKLRAYYEVVNVTARKIADTLPQAFPLNTDVTWRHGNTDRTATVIDHSDNRVKVRGGKGREYWVYAWNLLH